jgi:ADP-heptose:LPS heptosyltransferase
MSVFEKVVRHLPLSSNLFAGAISALCTNKQINKYLINRESALIRRIKNPKKLFIISDVNIGDAVNMQSCIESLRYYFPEAEIDYAYNRVADPIIGKNPHVSNAFPIFSHSLTPSKDESEFVQKLLRKKTYDFVINFCPFLPQRYLKNNGCPVLSPIRLIVDIVKAWGKRDGSVNIGYYTTQYMNQLYKEFPGNTHTANGAFHYSGGKIYLPWDIFPKRDNYMKGLGISPRDVILFFNPDTSNPYTFIDENLQVHLLKKLLSHDNFDRILLGSGISFKGIENKLYDKIPRTLKKKVVVFSEAIPIDIYAALLDMCDVFITGDTGPMHIAAARKICVDGNYGFRNRTAVVSIFGATDSKIYGYDSSKEGYMRANQDAPSKVFEGLPGCKKITCSIQRLTQECSGDMCFDGIDIDKIVSYINGYLSSLKE